MNVVLVEAGLRQRLRDDLADRVPHLDGVVLDPSRAREDLLVFLLTHRDDASLVVKDDRPGTGGALVDGHDEFVSHGECSFHFTVMRRVSSRRLAGIQDVIGRVSPLPDSPGQSIVTRRAAERRQ